MAAHRAAPSENAGRPVPTAQDLALALGRDSPIYQQAFTQLLELFRQAQGTPGVDLRYREWAVYLSAAVPSVECSEELFVNHTYLALVARLVARYFLSPGAPVSGAEELAHIIDGDYFREQGIDNYIEDDFFTWLLIPDIVASGESGLKTMGWLANALASYDFSRTPPGLLTGLYHQLTGGPPNGPSPGDIHTPYWLAEYVLQEELGLGTDGEQSVLDPCCGPGTFLAAAVRLHAERLAGEGQDDFDSLLHILDRVMGMDIHPLAVTVARTNYLLSLGSLVQGVHVPVLLPVYLSGPIATARNPGSSVLSNGGPEPVYTFHTETREEMFQVPDSVASNLESLDWLFARLPNYLRGAETRGSKGDDEAAQAVLNAYYNYLVAPKLRTPIPEPLSRFAADTMVATAAKLINRYLQGAGLFWPFILKNLPASVYMARRKFDLVVSNLCQPVTAEASGSGKEDRLGPTAAASGGESGREAEISPGDDPAGDQWSEYTALYLNDAGRTALIMPFDAQASGGSGAVTGYKSQATPLYQRADKVVDLSGVDGLSSPPYCVLIGNKSLASLQPASTTTLKGTAPSDDARWEEAREHVTIVDEGPLTLPD